MSLFFSGAVTSSPIKRRLRSSPAHRSPDVSLLSPDSSYVCYTPEGGAPSVCCRRSPRLLTNGYYAVTDDSFLWDEDGNVSLTPCAASVSYKENLFRVFRKRRRKSVTSALATLLSDVTESCQTWLDDRILAGVFRSDRDLKTKPAREEESHWPADDGGSCDFFTYDPHRVEPPWEKEAPPPKMMIQEEIGSEICQGSKRLDQPQGGLLEVPPPPAFHGDAWRQPRRRTQPSGLLLLTIFTLVLAAVVVTTVSFTGGLTRIAVGALTAALAIVAACVCDRGSARRTKTEDITSRNE
ncbi:transmembrane protein 71 [Corythoichthys intestinalis]|uniref:transmembrane protein 71 n=1 Tax=Corythoichthys intestinalis TaxID=161448 RepID=UPI0025A682B4|nr:transmembrane protein 71 [Corythoichthys intestinalis]XP_061794962.1 transmembrane protein 71-like [Nerophis lumbriciformis]